uniref:F-box domain-containing protein n=1 Tax=Tetradesmus obliquus TaxID=3088 RepID=A0A383VWU3_TETOB|eukprot:jgi/Sobl393_1/13411/SZX69955.1
MSPLSTAMEPNDETHTREVPAAEEAASTALLGLSIALEHPAASTDPRVLCAAARSCRAWREAVQQCPAHNTAVVLNTKKPVQQLQGFGQWLPKHAALVKSITAMTTAFDRGGGQAALGTGEAWQSHLAAAQELLQQALQAAAEVPSTHTAASAAAAVAAAVLPASSDAGVSSSTQRPQQQQGWRLASVSSDLPGAPRLLSLLPSGSLTHLHLDLQPGTPLKELSQLSRLSSL